MSFGKKNKKSSNDKRKVSLGQGGISNYSYMNNVRGDKEQTNKNKTDSTRNVSKSTKKKSNLLIRLEFIAFIAVIAVCTYSVMALSAEPKITVIGDANSTLSQTYEKSIYDGAKSELNSSFLNNNKITVNSSKITRDLEAKYPEFSQITLTMPLIGHKPIIYVLPATPTLLLKNYNGYYVISDQGQAIIYDPAPDSFKSLNIPLVNDQSGLVVNVGSRALTSKDVGFIKEAILQLSAKGYAVSSMTLPSQSREVDVYLTGQPYYIKYNLESSDARIQSGSFLAAINNLNKQSIKPGQYVDVRTNGRVYYK